MSTATIPTIAEAQADLDQLRADIAAWREKRENLAHGLQQTQAGAAAAALSGASSTEIATRLGTLKEEIQIAEGAIAILDARLRPAQRAVLTARIEAQRAAVVPVLADIAARIAEYEGRLEADRRWEEGDGRRSRNPIAWRSADGRKVYTFDGQTSAMLEDLHNVRSDLRQLEDELAAFEQEERS